MHYNDFLFVIFENQIYYFLTPKTYIMKQFYLQIAACLVVALSYGKTPETALNANTFDDHLTTSQETLNRAVPKKAGFFKLTLENEAQRYHTAFYFNEKSTFGLDPGYDAGIMGDIAPSFSIYSKLMTPGEYGHVNLAVQSLPYTCLMEETIIPLSININQGLAATIKISDKYLQPEIEVLLEDTQTNTLTLLTKKAYSFTADQTLSGEGRFNIIIRNTTTYKETLSDEEHSITKLRLFHSQSEQSIIIKGDVAMNSKLSLTDLQGRPILEATLKETTINKVNVPTIKPGIYIITLQENSNRISKKVIIK